MPLKNRVIMVLGMHRSGTSACTGVLGLLGVDLGAKLLAASATNQSGYWEHAEIVAVHDQLLMALGSSWDDPGPLPEGWWKSETAAGYRARLREIVTRDFGAAPLWALKDPRLCRLLPFWIPLLAELECEPLWVLLARHPAESIRSLEKRERFASEKSELLWLRYTLEAERETQHRNRVIITLDQLMQAWEQPLSRVQAALGLPWPVSPERAAAQVKEFLDPQKRHHQAPETSGLSPWTRDAYAALAAGANGDEAKMAAMMERIHAGNEAADALYWRFIRSRGADLERSLAETNAKYGAMSQSCEKFKEKYHLSKEKLAVKSAEARTMKEQLRQFERSAGGKLTRLLGRFKPRETGGVARVDIPKVAEPELSIIVSAGKDLEQTARCLRAVRKQTGASNYEVLAVGAEAAVKGLEGWGNIVTVLNAETVAFGEAHNRAVRQARGPVVIFLDDSVTVGPGWREALLKPLRSEPMAGAVGAEAGTLTAEGGIELIEEADSKQLREADFCTTTCLAITKNLFFQVGGFDGDYLPVAEVNLGIKIRQTRHKVLHQPHCPVARQKTGRRMDPKRLEAARPKLRRWAEAMA